MTSTCKRVTQTRRDLGVEADPDIPIPDQPPGKNIKKGVHGYYGSNYASDFGEAVPVISVQTVPVQLG